MTKVQEFTKLQLKTDLPDIRPGDTVEVHQIIKEKDKQRIQVYEGLVIARKHGKGISATITVRKVISGVGVEKVFPIHSPFIEKIKVIKRSKVRRAKLYYLRHAKGEKAKLKRKDFANVIIDEEPTITENPVPTTEEPTKSDGTLEIKETEK
jgi:large subunit ribosomal protein L19